MYKFYVVPEEPVITNAGIEFLSTCHIRTGKTNKVNNVNKQNLKDQHIRVSHTLP